MITKALQTIIHTFAGLPAIHRVGIVALTGVLALLTLPVNNDPAEHTEATAGAFIPSAEAAASFAADQTATSDITINPAELKFDNHDATVEPSSIVDAIELSHVAKALSETAPEIIPESNPAPADTNIHHSITVQKGDSLSTIFKRAGVESKYMYHLIHGHEKANSLAKIFPGHQLEFVTDDAGKLLELHHIKNLLNKQVFTRTDEGYAHEVIERTPTIKLVSASGTISQSLYNAAKAADLKDGLIMQFAEIFGWDVDFALDIRERDSFKVVYEEKYLDGALLGTGEIVAAEFVNRGEIIQAVRYIDSNGDTQYYTPEGRNMRKAFLRAPVDFRRISSGFNPARLHPITKQVRPHRGIDYAAATGTPVWSPGDGKVIKSDFSKYNGNYIVIQHSNNIQTKYLHLHKRNVKVGQRVKQKQIIGSVGSTGLSTAPHLHYEFLLNGVHRNPRTIVSKLPKADPVAPEERERFFAATKELVAMLEPSDKNSQLASTEPEDTAPTSM